MKVKTIGAIVLSVIMLSVILVLNYQTTDCALSHNEHNCIHLAQVNSTQSICEACFSGYDQYGHCPICDYNMCPNCGETKLCKDHYFCHHCGEWKPMRTCKKCGESYIECNCDEPDFGF